MSAPELTKVEQEAARIERLREEHSDPASWEEVRVLTDRGWEFPGLSEALILTSSPSTPAAFTATNRADGVDVASGGTVRELIENVRLWEAGQMSRAPESRSKAISPGYAWPQA